MISSLLSLIVTCVVLGMLYWLVLQLEIPQPFAGLIRVATVILCMFLVLGVFLGHTILPRFHL